MVTVFLGLGSNLGNREKNIHDAVDALVTQGLQDHRLSSIIETEPVGGPPQGRFLNAVLKGLTTFTPQQLLSLIKQIERDLGRQPAVRNGPRTIDIDILLYDNIRLVTDDLVIPHPRMQERDFVLRPLQELGGIPLKENIDHARHP